MQKINIKDLSLEIDIIQLLNLYEINKEIYIDLNCKLYNKIEKNHDKPIIYKSNKNTLVKETDAKKLALKLFEDYRPVLTGTKCIIKPLSNWLKIIDLNKDLMLYFDHQSDGVEVFEDEILENFGWNASVLEVSYRQICDFIENNCEGTLLCFENDVQFNGFVIVKDINIVRNKVKEFIKLKALEHKEENILDLEDEDVIEALKLFENKG